MPRDSQDPLTGSAVDQITAAVGEIERLMGNVAARRSHWDDLHRHLHFGQGHDWHDIHAFDWPSVRPDVQAAGFTNTDPLPVPDFDLGQAAAEHLTRTATIALPWDRLDDDGFERLLYDLLRAFPEHKNVQLPMHTHAPDRGRDLADTLTKVKLWPPPVVRVLVIATSGHFVDPGVRIGEVRPQGER
ncbi:MAG: hypothetical protein ACRDQ4_12965 [Pseudonocardiaceae bacterium]